MGLDDTHHEGKTEMDYVTSSTSILELDDSNSDMSMLDDDGSRIGNTEESSFYTADNEGSEDNGSSDSDDDRDDSEYSTEGDDYDTEDDDETNYDAYDTSSVSGNGTQKTEQAGVLHLIHGWTQRGHSNDVSHAGIVTLFYSLF